VLVLTQLSSGIENQCVRPNYAANETQLAERLYVAVQTRTTMAFLFVTGHAKYRDTLANSEYPLGRRSAPADYIDSYQSRFLSEQVNLPSAGDATGIC
jgi:hypothetical protein